MEPSMGWIFIFIDIAARLVVYFIDVRLYYHFWISLGLVGVVLQNCVSAVHYLLDGVVFSVFRNKGLAIKQAHVVQSILYLFADFLLLIIGDYLINWGDFDRHSYLICTAGLLVLRLALQVKVVRIILLDVRRSCILLHILEIHPVCLADAFQVFVQIVIIKELVIILTRVCLPILYFGHWAPIWTSGIAWIYLGGRFLHF